MGVATGDGATNDFTIGGVGAGRMRYPTEATMRIRAALASGAIFRRRRRERAASFASRRIVCPRARPSGEIESSNSIIEFLNRTLAQLLQRLPQSPIDRPDRQ